MNPENELEVMDAPPTGPEDRLSDIVEVAMGPHHPSTHGVFRMDVAVDRRTDRAA